MALTIDSRTTDVISLEEYLDFCDAQPDLEDAELAIATADKLKALANNQQFLADYLNQEMKDLGRFQEGNDFKPSTFVLHRARSYTVRAVVWLPASEVDNPEIFSYYETHDHNFDFLTCGYHGSGYRTVLYRYEHERVIGYPDEPVELEFVEDTTLPAGKLMYYFASKDVHTQLPPEELSISLNLILPRRKRRPATQYEFDAERGTVLSHFSDMQMRRRVFAAVRHIGDDNSLDLLATIARRHADARTRALAWETLIARKPEEAEAFLRAAMNDVSPYVKALSRRACDRATAEQAIPRRS